MTGQHTLKMEAARAGVSVEEYLSRLSQGESYCYRCRDWHKAGAFPADGRRHNGLGGSCTESIRAEVRAALAQRGQLPSSAAVWVIRRPAAAAGQPGGPSWAYWHGPGRPGGQDQNRAGTWSQALDDHVARFPGSVEALDALVGAFGGASAVPAGCRLVRLS